MTRTLDPYDELAALFLTESVVPRNGATGTAVRELIVVGHLPVRGGLWLAPYADAVGRESGPTALLRLDDEPPHVQVFHAPAVERAEPAPLHQVVTELSGQVRRWIVRPPIDASYAELVLAGVDRITILSSADEAARVTAYRIIKDLHQAAARVGVTLPHLGVALLGCDEPTGRRVFDRLQRTAQSHLEVDVSLDLCLHRMDAGIVSSGWRRCVQEDEPPTLERIMAWTVESPVTDASPEPVAADTPEPPAASTRVPAPPIQMTPPPPISAPPPIPERVPPPDPVAAEPEDGMSAERWVARRTLKLRPKAESDIEPKTPCLPVEPDEDGRPRSLAEYVDGLIAMPVRCPRHETVEIALDERGGMHLLGAPATLRDMAVVRQWAHDHRELLAMACPEHVIDAAATVQLHVFATEPLDVADLHGSDMHLHVLAPVDVDGKRGWYAARLNRP